MTFTELEIGAALVVATAELLITLWVVWDAPSSVPMKS